MKKIIAMILLMVTMLAAIPGESARAEQGAEIHTVKVTFDFINGYQMKNEDGNCGGYAYEMLQYMKIYAPWRYEYVGCEDGFNDNLNKILTGEADLALNVIKTPEREKLFDFSDSSIGVSIDVLMVSALREAPCVVGDYSTYNGLRIGVVGTEQTPSIQHDSLANFALGKGFGYETVYFHDFSALAQALNSGDVDAIASTHMLLMENMNIIDQMATHEIYITVKKGNRKLLQEANYALNQLNINSPGLQAVLKNKYYPSTMDGNAILTPEETDYLRECQNHGVVFTAVINPDAAPLSSYSGNAAHGLIVDITRQILEQAGLSVQMLVPQNQEEYRQVAQTADLLLDMRWNLNLAEQAGLTLTEPYYTTTVSRLTLKEGGKADRTIGVVKDSSILYSFIPTVLTNETLLYYDSTSEAIAAVLAGKADCIYLYSDIAQSAVYNDSLNRLTSVVMPVYREKFCVGVRESLSHSLSAIMNKAALSIGDDDLLRLSAPYLNLPERTLSFWAYLYQSPARMAAAALALMTLLSLCIILISVRRRRKKERVLIMELREASAAKTDFLSRISHDMRTPMNAIIGFSDIGMDSRNLEEAADCFQKVNAAAKYLLGMMNDVLDMSRIESGKLQLHYEPYCYQEFEDTLKTILTPRAEEKHICLRFQRNMPPASVAILDKQRLQQVFVNLIGNAIKFTPEGGRVEMNTQSMRDENGLQFVRFTVSDNGVGMSEDFIRNRMFHTFEQERREETSNEHGTGLGLSIVSRLVEGMDGRIACQSKPGEGTTFTVELPIQMVQDYEPDAPETEQDGTFDLSGKRILLCEDHPLNAQIALRLLQKVGVQTVWVEDGEKGVQAFQQSKKGDYDAILMDVRMPIMDGFAATAAIRALQRPDAGKIPIIAMTANAFEHDAEQSLKAGMSAYLTKPIEPKKLYDTLNRFLCGE